MSDAVVESAWRMHPAASQASRSAGGRVSMRPCRRAGRRLVGRVEKVPDNGRRLDANAHHLTAHNASFDSAARQYALLHYTGAAEEAPRTLEWPWFEKKMGVEVKGPSFMLQPPVPG